MTMMLAASPCLANIMSFGIGSGAPGQKASFSLSIDPDEPVTNFDCLFEYDNDLLTLDDVELSEGAVDNGIYRIWCNESSTGRVHIYTESWGDHWWLDDISRLAILTFIISSNAPAATTHVKFMGPAYYETDYAGYWHIAMTQNGSITIAASGPTPTPTPPSGNPPELSLRMESTMVLTYGETPVVRYQVRANGWKGYSADAYLAVVLPDGRLFYRNSRGGLTSNQTPVVGKMTIGDASGDIGFMPIPDNAPAGLYTIYGALAAVGKDPLKAKHRISNLEDTQFQLMPGTPTPTLPE
jgi:hypothetical protein